MEFLKSFAILLSLLHTPFLGFSQSIQEKPDYTRHPKNSNVCQDLVIGDFSCDECSGSDKKIIQQIRGDVYYFISKYTHCSCLDRRRIADLLKISDDEKQITSLNDISDTQVTEIVNITKAKGILFGDIMVQGDESLLITLQVFKLSEHTLEGSWRFAIPKDKYSTFSEREVFVEQGVAKLILGVEPPRPVAGFAFFPEGCDMIPCEITFTNNSQNADSYVWDFGDGQISTIQNPTHIFNEDGEYKITLTAKKGDLRGNISKTVKVEEKFIKAPDERQYQLIKMGDQLWMAENLNYAVKGFDNLTGTSCLDEWVPAYCAKYGRLYRSIQEAEAACAALGKGWYVPAREDWYALVRRFGENEAAFNALKKGGRSNMNIEFGGYGAGWAYLDVGTAGYYWTSSPGAPSCNFRNGKVDTDVSGVIAPWGFNCRCVKK